MSGSGYRLGGELGRGALGRVLRLEASGPDQAACAGKILHPSHAADARARERFAAEAEVASHLVHENIVCVFGLEDIDGHEVMRMELVEGDDLATYLAKQGALPIAELARIGMGICAGLDAAHSAGLVHRDLKPHNILLTSDGIPKIADFGMARAASFAGVQASAFAVAGTPDYMAPESIDPLAVDSRSDLYSLGCLLYELATGRPPFLGATAFAVLEAHREAPLPELPDDWPEAFRVLLTQLLAKSPADRPQAASVVRDRLAAIVDTSSALVPYRSVELVVQGRCSHCGQRVHSALSVCLACGASSMSLEPGNACVFVTGPGVVGDKLDNDLRGTLYEWIDGNPKLGLDAKKLHKQVPRLPFVLVAGVSLESATALARAVEGLGLECEAHKGSRYKLPAVRKKARMLSLRSLAIGGGSMMYMINPLGAWLLPVGLGVVALSLASGAAMGGAAAAKLRNAKQRELPASLASSLASLGTAIAGIQELRHREALRAVVDRVLTLTERLAEEQQQAMEGDLARLVDLAVVSCARLDAIDRKVASEDLRNPDAGTRELLRERDRHVAQLLQVSSFLDEFASRAALLRSSAGRETQRQRDDDLEDLRSHVFALEEIQSL